MPPLPDRAALERLVAEAGPALGLELDPQWRPSIAEHYRRLLEAAEVIESSGLDLGANEPAVKFEP